MDDESFFRRTKHASRFPCVLFRYLSNGGPGLTKEANGHFRTCRDMKEFTFIRTA